METISFAEITQKEKQEDPQYRTHKEIMGGFINIFQLHEQLRSLQVLLDDFDQKGKKVDGLFFLIVFLNDISVFQDQAGGTSLNILCKKVNYLFNDIRDVRKVVFKTGRSNCFINRAAAPFEKVNYENCFGSNVYNYAEHNFDFRICEGARALSLQDWKEENPTMYEIIKIHALGFVRYNLTALLKALSNITLVLKEDGNLN